MKGYMVMELWHVSEMVVIKLKEDAIFNTFWKLYNKLSFVIIEFIYARMVQAHPLY